MTGNTMGRKVKNLLSAWGHWSYTRLGTEYPGVACMLQGSVPRGLGGPSLSDEEGQAVERAVLSLKCYDRDGYRIICLHYQHRASFRAIGRAMRQRHQYVSEYCERAEAYIAGQLHSLLEQVA